MILGCLSCLSCLVPLGLLRFLRAIGADEDPELLDDSSDELSELRFLACFDTGLDLIGSGSGSGSSGPDSGVASLPINKRSAREESSDKKDRPRVKLAGRALKIMSSS